MNINIKHLLKKISSPQQRIVLKRWKRHIKSFFCGGRKTTLIELREILTKTLGLQAGDRIVVTSSFGNLNAAYAPEDVVNLLMEIVTEKGSIMMPYYPPTNSTVWAKDGCVFDMNETRSGMGVITNVFSKMNGVVMSVHPTKAVCVWGKDAKSIVEGHENSTTPFYWDSPYGKFLKYGSKSIGLGVKNIPMVHAIEDILSDPYDFYYQKKKYRLKVVKGDGSELVVDTFVHNETVMEQCLAPGDYTASLNVKSYRKINFGLAFLYVIDNCDLFEETKKAFARGYTRKIEKK
ncbi:MAG: AAC(3) family N-acetyltransferase [Bacteroidales bacterium]|nr:AAC(3) family N-acetyltransferase [Bacteroidales bacterium]MBR4498055.1 AAC(3) family N-acetyltransferase [Bacteroidales bacterium]